MLAAIIDRVGPYRIQYSEPIFQTLVRSIVYQQLNGKAALTIFNRLAEAAKADPLTPESILRLRPARMRALGLSKQKLKYIRELARFTKSGEVDFELYPTLEDTHVIEHLTRVKGVGVWTVAYVFDLRAAAAGCAAHRRLRRARGYEEGVRSARNAQARGNGAHRGGVAAVLFGGELVSVAKSGESRSDVTNG